MSVQVRRLDRSRVILDASKDGRTKSEFAQDCDINLIVKRANKIGVDPFAARKGSGVFADISGYVDYTEAHAKVAAAEELFMELDPEVREAFDNDPGKLVIAAQTEEGLKKLIKLGLAKEVVDEGIDANPAGSPGDSTDTSQAKA